MNTAFFIAKKYFLSTKKRVFINFISIVSMLGVAIGTAALIFVLSIFNGLEGIIGDLHASFTPEMTINTIKNKTFNYTNTIKRKITAIKGIAHIAEVIEDNALISYRNKQMVVNLKGVSSNYANVTLLDNKIHLGKFALKDEGFPAAIIGYGIRQKLSIGGFRNNLSNEEKEVRKKFQKDYMIEFWYPKKGKRLAFGNLDPKNNLNRQVALPIGVFAVEKQFDDRYVFVPLSVSQKLMNYTNERTSLELKLNTNADISAIKKELQKVLGKNFRIQSQEDLQESFISPSRVEKLFVYITFSFILGIASLNIFFSLMMLAIDKKKDVAVLKAMGADKKFIRKIFMFEGSIIAFIGAFLGVIFSIIFILLQQNVGLITMTKSSVVSHYPIKLEIFDLIAVAIPIVLITLLASYFPANKAANIDIKEHI